MTNTAKDRIYASKQDKIDDFVFDEKVASVFEDMVLRSVPGYKALNELLPTVANKFIQPKTNVYDLGCSLGEASLRIAKSIHCCEVTIFAVDNSQAMIDRLIERIASLGINTLIKPKFANVVEVEIKNASFIVLNYTLQFIDQLQRDELVTKIYSSLNKQGGLLLSEKIRYEDQNEEMLMQALYDNYKRDNDYSDLEISQKREALENVLVRDTNEQHLNRLHKAGFSKVNILAKHLNFVTYLAVK